MFVLCCADSGLCHELITHSEESYRLFVSKCVCVCVCVPEYDIEILKTWRPRSDLSCYTTEEEKEEPKIFVKALISKGFNCNSLYSPSPVFCYSLYFVCLLSLCTCDVFVVGNDVVES